VAARLDADEVLIGADGEVGERCRNHAGPPECLHTFAGEVVGETVLAGWPGLTTRLLDESHPDSHPVGSLAGIVAEAVLPEARELLSRLSPGSRIKKAPEDLFPKATVR